MKVALLSDIHANEVALAATLEQAKADGAERLLCCGDFVGYYHAPGAMLALLDAWSWQGIRGNHEEMLERFLIGKDRDAIHRRYGSGIAIAAEGCLTQRVQGCSACRRAWSLRSTAGAFCCATAAPGTLTMMFIPMPRMRNASAWQAAVRIWSSTAIRIIR